MPALSCGRATSLFALLLSQSCPDALPLQEQEDVCGSWFDTRLSLLQQRAGRRASVKDGEDNMAASEAEGAAGHYDLEDALVGANIEAAAGWLNLLGDAPIQKIHVHFHKAGGTFMCSLAKRAGELTPEPDVVNCNWKERDGVRVSGQKSVFPSCDERRKYYAESGITYSQLEREVLDDDFCEGIQYSCLFRDPIALIESNINYEERDGGPNCSARVSHMRDLVSKGLHVAGTEDDKIPGLSPTYGWKFMDNMQTRLLSGAIDVPPAHITREHLEIAKRRLAKFHAVARLEDMTNPTERDRFLKKMGWSFTFDDSSVKSNPTSHYETLTEADKLWLTNLNKYDYELYRHAGSYLNL